MYVGTSTNCGCLALAVRDEVSDRVMLFLIKGKKAIKKIEFSYIYFF